MNGVNFYRIKQVDKDGTYQYSSIQKVNITDVIRHWNIYPNPARTSTTVYALNNYAKADISVSDLNGKIVYHSSLNNVVASQQLIIPLQQLSKGVYVIKITTEQNIDTQKLIVE